ncbi:MAG: hypothetical protein K0S92_1498, partial [Desertimonas sp.]|nr:hypothetical protein [Desertimonas sp.]
MTEMVDEAIDVVRLRLRAIDDVQHTGAQRR